MSDLAKRLAEAAASTGSRKFSACHLSAVLGSLPDDADRAKVKELILTDARVLSANAVASIFKAEKGLQGVTLGMIRKHRDRQCRHCQRTGEFA